VDKLSQDFETFHGKTKELIGKAQERMEKPLPVESTPLYYDRPTDDYAYQQQQDQRRNDMFQLQDELDFQDSIIHDRDQNIKVIQGQMIEVNEIFRDLAKLVEDQGQMIDNIQTNISSAGTNVETAVSEVKDASKYQQSSRKKICFVMIFITVVVAIIIVVIYFTVKH